MLRVSLACIYCKISKALASKHRGWRQIQATIGKRRKEVMGDRPNRELRCFFQEDIERALEMESARYIVEWSGGQLKQEEEEWTSCPACGAPWPRRRFEVSYNTLKHSRPLARPVTFCKSICSDARWTPTLTEKHIFCLEQTSVRTYMLRVITVACRRTVISKRCSANVEVHG